MNSSIKKLTKNDWQLYKQLRLQMLAEEPQAYSQTLEDVSKRSDDEWKEKTESDTMAILVVMVDEIPAGMNGLFYEDQETVDIWGMFIKKEYRGKGFGRKLMEAILEEIKKDIQVKKIKISVIASQAPAWELYKTLGYKEVGRVNDEILMEKYI